MITKAQIKSIWTLARDIGDLDSDMLHALVFRITGNKHISRLTDMQATTVLKELSRLNRKVTKNGLMSEGQKKKIFKFMYDLDWTHTFPNNGRKMLNTKRLDGFCKTVVGVGLYSKLTYPQASKIIEGLKKMVARSAEGKVQGAVDVYTGVDFGVAGGDITVYRDVWVDGSETD